MNKCCNHNCNQGRNCPHEESDSHILSPLLWFLGTVFSVVIAAALIAKF